MTQNKAVLILVVMEYTQWAERSAHEQMEANVLILVVMEYTQWEIKSYEELESELS